MEGLADLLINNFCNFYLKSLCVHIQFLVLNNLLIAVC